MSLQRLLMLPTWAEMKLVRDGTCGISLGSPIFSGDAARPGPGWLQLKEPF